MFEQESDEYEDDLLEKLKDKNILKWQELAY